MAVILLLAMTLYLLEPILKIVLWYLEKRLELEKNRYKQDLKFYDEKLDLLKRINGQLKIIRQDKKGRL